MTVMARYPLRLALFALAGATLLGALLLADRTPASGQVGTALVSAGVLPAGTGTVSGAGRFAIGTEVTLTATPADGYVFHAWTSDSGGCAGASATCTLTVSLTLGHHVTAHFRTAPPPPAPPPPTTYTLTTTANPAGSGDLTIRRQGEIINRIATSSEHSDGTVVIVEPRANTARGWAFSAWGSGGDHAGCTTTGGDPSCTVTMGQDRTITANFVRTHYLLTATASPAEGATVNGGGLFSATQSPAPTATVTIMTNTGYRFTGWSGACTGSSTCSVTMDAEKSVTANFVRTYELTTGVSPSGSGTLDHGGGTQDAGTAISITATPNLGYRFSEWVSDAGGCPLQSRYSPVCAFTMSRAVTATAHFLVGPTYMLTATASPAAGGTLTGGGEYNGGTGVDVTQTPNAGYRFSHWTGGACSGSGSCSVTMTRDRQVVAIYVARYTLTTSVSPSAGGSVSAGGTFDEGTDVTVTATPNTGYRFVGWSGHCTGSGACIVTLAENSAVTANFVQRDDFLLLTGATPFAGGRVSEGGVYGFGIVATVTATANPGWRFDRWTGACTGSGACSVTMDDDKLVSAHFVSTAATVTLRAHAQPFRGGTVTGGGDYAPGTVVTITATPEAGYTFEGWSGGCRAVASTTCILTVNYPRIVIGRFAPPPPPPPADSGGGGFAPAPGSNANVIVTSRVRGEAPADPAFRFHFTCTEAGGFALAPDETRSFAIEADDFCTLRVTDDEDAVRVSGRINAFPYTRGPICVFTRDGDSGDLFTDRSFIPGDYTAEVVFDYATRPEVATILLASGLTFIAWPGDGRSIDEAVGSFATAVHFWDAAGQRWLSWFPGGEALGINTLTAFRTGGVYVIARRAAFDGWRVEVSDSRAEAPSVVRLVQGVTFLEWRGAAAAIEDALGDRIAAVTAVYSWDVDEQRWLSWFPGGDDLGINTLTGFEPGGIYVVSAAAAIDWRVIDEAAVAGAGDDEPPAC